MGAKHCQQQAIERTERRLKEATRLRGARSSGPRAASAERDPRRKR
jgi:hypothetical protein